MSAVATKLRPGQKMCQECGTVVNGPRVKVCPTCETPFTFKNTPTTVNENGEVVKTRKVGFIPSEYEIPADVKLTVIFAPAGEILCPFPFSDDLTDEDVLNWADECRRTYLEDGEFLRNEALVYIMSQAIPPDHKDRPATRAAIRRLLMAMPDITYRDVPVD